jgi:hypothetical protein
MVISLFLAKALGLYLLILGITMFANKIEFLYNLREMIKHRPVMYLSAFITLILGILLVISHNLWVWDWRLIITLLAWWIFIKGVLRVIYPQIDRRWQKLLDSNTFYYCSATLVIILGLILGYFGFIFYS